MFLTDFLQMLREQLVGDGSFVSGGPILGLKEAFARPLTVVPLQLRVADGAVLADRDTTDLQLIPRPTIEVVRP